MTLMAANNDWIGLNNGHYGHPAGEISELIIEKLIATFLNDGDAAVDCGAADGRMLRRMLIAAGHDGAVIAFEPIPHIHDRLKVSFPARNVAAYQMCVSDTIKDAVKFYFVKNRRWVSSLSPDNLAGYEVEELSVPVTTLDKILVDEKAVGERKVGFIKLDIEGAEFPAIKGGRRVIELDRPFIVFENGLVTAADSFGYTREEFFRFFEEINYQLFDVFGVPLKAEHWNSVGTTVAWNFVAVHKDDPRLKQFTHSISDILAGAQKILLSPALTGFRKFVGRFVRRISSH